MSEFPPLASGPRVVTEVRGVGVKFANRRAVGCHGLFRGYRLATAKTECSPRIGIRHRFGAKQRWRVGRRGQRSYRAADTVEVKLLDTRQHGVIEASEPASQKIDGVLTNSVGLIFVA